MRLIHESQYVTNQLCMDPSTWLTPATWRRLLDAKFFTSSTMKIRKFYGYKTLWHKNAVAYFKENKALGYSTHVRQLLKWSLYMSRVMRKETLHKYTRICMQSVWKVWFRNSRQKQLVSRFCRASTLILDRKDSVETFVEL